MIKSMTGAGRARKTNEQFDISVKVQSVNNRFLDLHIRLQHSFSEFEFPLRKLCQSMVGRGKVDVTIDIQDLRQNSLDASLNEPLVKAILNAAEELRDTPGIQDRLSLDSLLFSPQVLKTDHKEPEDKEAFLAILLEAAEAAVNDLIESRSAEGRRLADDISSRLENCLLHIKEISNRTKEVKAEYFAKIKDRVGELADQIDIDEHRLEQEVAFLVDRSDITEELVRLGSHLEKMKELLQEKIPVGKKLDFMLQEMNREINTVGAKSKNIEISRSVVELKSELEKMREQVQNVE